MIARRSITALALTVALAIGLAAPAQAATAATSRPATAGSTVTPPAPTRYWWQLPPLPAGTKLRVTSSWVYPMHLRRCVVQTSDWRLMIRYVAGKHYRVAMTLPRADGSRVWVLVRVSFARSSCS